MAIQDMTKTRQKTRDEDDGYWFSDEVYTPVIGSSDTYILPVNPIVAIGAKLTVTGVTATVTQNAIGAVAVKEQQTIKITHIADAEGYITINLNSVAFTLLVTAGESINDIATQIRASIFSGWVVTGATDSAIFTADANGVRGGTYSFAGGTGAIQFSQSSHARLKAGTATFTAWNNTDAIPIATTGWKAVSSAGVATGYVIVKTY